MLRPPPPLFPEFRLRLSPFLIGLLLAVLGVVHGRAQTTLYWDTNGSTSGAGATPSATWSNSNTDKNWSTGFFGNSSTVQWTAGSNAFFSAGFDASSAFTVTVSGTISVAGMTVLMGDPTFTGGTLNFSDASPDIAIIVGSNTTINSTIAGSNGLNKSNSGTLILGGSNTYTGTTSISAGVVNLRSATALGSTTGGTTVASGAALEVQNNLTVSGETLALNGTGVSGNGALRNISGANTWTGAVSLGSAARIQSDAGTLTISGAVTGGGNALTVGGAGSTTLSGAVNLGSGTFTKDGTGAVTLSGSTANTSTGAVAVNDGTLNLAKSSNTNAVGTGAVTVGDGTGAASSANLVLQASRQLATTTALTLNADGRLGVNNFTEKIDTIAGTGLIDLATSGFLTVGANNGSSMFAGSITGTGTLEKAGTGTLTFGSTISFGGTLQLLGGTLALNGTSLTVDTLHITGNTVIDFGNSAASILNATTVIVDAGVTLTVVNWTNAVDFLYATNNPGATQLARVAFTGYSASSTAWLPFDHQITPAPEPRLYGALLTAATLGVTGWIRRRRAAA
ncbi:MAG TPA: autotransporter-associated beta strand repeat-containing protein [Opitutaceae bacterium]|nr:autotransporter-associated beta strand repeat-containing protein [Opitutaceae bacterium]